MRHHQVAARLQIVHKVEQATLQFSTRLPPGRSEAVEREELRALDRAQTLPGLALPCPEVLFAESIIDRCIKAGSPRSLTSTKKW